MPDPLSQALRDWQNFYILVGGAAAALAGLMFVAISLGSRLITQEDIPALRVFASPTLIHFISVLATSAVVLIPIVTRASLGVVLLLAGVVGLVWTLSTQPLPPGSAARTGPMRPPRVSPAWMRTAPPRTAPPWSTPPRTAPPWSAPPWNTPPWNAPPWNAPPWNAPPWNAPPSSGPLHPT